jgi:putative redox protein
MTHDQPGEQDSAPATRTPRVRARLVPPYRVDIDVRDGHFTLVSDQGPEDGGEGSGPAPSELLFSSLASCYAMAMVWCARKRRVTLPDLEISVDWGYDKAERMYAGVVLEARSSLATDAPDEFERLVHLAEEVCWVTRTIRSGRPITVRAAARE